MSERVVAAHGVVVVVVVQGVVVAPGVVVAAHGVVVVVMSRMVVVYTKRQLDTIKGNCYQHPFFGYRITCRANRF